VTLNPSDLQGRAQKELSISTVANTIKNGVTIFVTLIILSCNDLAYRKE